MIDSGKSTQRLIVDANSACSALEDRLRREGWGNLTRQVAGMVDRLDVKQYNQMVKKLGVNLEICKKCGHHLEHHTGVTSYTTSTYLSCLWETDRYEVCKCKEFKWPVQ